MLYLLMLRRGEGTVEVWGEIVWKLNFQPCTEGKIDDTGPFRHTWENAVTPIHDLESNCEAPILGEICLGHMYCINVQNSFRAVSDRDSYQFQEALSDSYQFLKIPRDSLESILWIPIPSYRFFCWRLPKTQKDSAPGVSGGFLRIHTIFLKRL